MSTAKKLGRKSDHRDHVVRNLVTSLVLYEKVRTTHAKAKLALPVAERLLTRARTGTLAARRSALAQLFDTNAVQKLFEDFPERWGTRTSGFVRLTRLAPRAGDNASMAELELLVTPLEQVVAEKPKAAAAKVVEPAEPSVKKAKK
jgi:large subunit ribosomal protein L17